jgi:hypothetical protein
MGSLKSAFEDAFNMLCGEKIGQGIHRQVFECKLLPHLVVKVESDDFRYFANVLENKIWGDAEHHKKVADWLAPCTHLSCDGRILLQYRCDPLPLNYTMPEKVPAFMTDLKRENFGLLEGRLVCLDYAMILPSLSLTLKKAYW